MYSPGRGVKKSPGNGERRIRPFPGIPQDGIPRGATLMCNWLAYLVHDSPF